MFTIKNNIKNEIIIKNSKFITYLYRVNDLEDVKESLSKINKEYRDATHRCFAYIVDNEYRFSDDGEPGSTAGVPIYNVLKGNNLNYVLAVVIRYFGGIKLGTGGLVRAYSKSVKDALNLCEILALKEGYRIKIIFNYEKKKEIDYILRDSKIINSIYEIDVEYECLVDIDTFNKLKNIINIEVIKKEYI